MLQGFIWTVRHRSWPTPGSCAMPILVFVISSISYSVLQDFVYGPSDPSS
jgi:hypothetical protein